jgi:uncharacterized protein (DUF1499 family)
MSAGAFAGLFAGTPPTDLGVREGRLKPCPATPNCVSSQAQDASHRVAALRFQGSAQVAFERLKAVLAAMPRMRIVEARDGYLRAEAASRLFGFVDDLEFYFDAPTAQVHVRSASRIGYSDLGVNRARVEAIRKAFES